MCYVGLSQADGRVPPCRLFSYPSLSSSGDWGPPDHSLAHCYGALYWKALRQIYIQATRLEAAAFENHNFLLCSGQRRKAQCDKSW